MQKRKAKSCPLCDCQIVARIHRNFFEKLKSRKNKYKCAACGSLFFRKSSSRG